MRMPWIASATSMPLLAFALVAPVAGSRASPSPQAEPAAQEASPHSESIVAAMACLDGYLEAFNDRDAAAFDATLNFPSYRLAAGAVAIQQPGETRLADDGPNKPDWAYSKWVNREVIQAGADKVHVAGTFARYRSDGSFVAKFDSLYIITRQDGHWGIKIRSSFAPR